MTGATAGYAHGVAAVLGHTGSPVSNTSAVYPMRYRWRENTYGNQNMTAHDLGDVRVDEGSEQYHLEWYYNADPRKITTPANPDLATLRNPAKGWIKLAPETPANSYVNGYIRKLESDERFPHVKSPTITTGGSSGTYYCDYAFLVSTFEVRCVRRRGNACDGTAAGPRCVGANNAFSTPSWDFGGELFFIQ